MSALVVESGLFSYCVYYSARRRSVALQIKQGKLIVRAPLGYSLVDVKTLVEQKQPWILKHLHQSRAQVKPDWLALQQIPLLGTMLTLEVHRAVSSSVELCHDKLVVTVSRRTQANNYNNRVLSLLQQWYKTQALSWFMARTDYWQGKMQLQAKDLVIGNWRTKWGYCKNTAQLGFNWRLMMAPDWVADYVVVHELAHLKHLNHSNAFWQLVGQHYPQVQHAKIWLRQHQHQLEL